MNPEIGEKLYRSVFMAGVTENVTLNKMKNLAMPELFQIILVNSEDPHHSHVPNLNECQAEKLKYRIKRKPADHTEQPPAQLQ